MSEDYYPMLSCGLYKQEIFLYTKQATGRHDFECFYPLPDNKPQLCAQILGPCSWLIAWLLTELPENVFFKPQKYLQKKA